MIFRVGAASVTASMLLALNASAGNQFSGVAVTEIPAQAAQLVKQATASQREQIAQTIIAEALSQKSTMAAAVVSAIAKGSPDVAAASAVAAAAQQPKQIGQIAKAAVSAAPEQVSKIVSALSQKFPTQYNLIALAAFEAAPKSGSEILAAVGSAVPTVKGFIARATSSSLPGVIAETQTMLQVAAQVAKVSPEQLIGGSTVVASGLPSYSPVALPPSTIGAPYQPNSHAPDVISASGLGVVPNPTPRTYSGP